MSSRLCVLLVDDNPADRLLAEEVFEAYEPTVDLQLCDSGSCALTVLRTCQERCPDLLLLDLNMPGMSGFEVLAAIRSDPQLQQLPVVILSTSDAQQYVTQAYELHASSYLVKQAQFDQFAAQVDHLVQYWLVCRRPAPVQRMRSR